MRTLTTILLLVFTVFLTGCSRQYTVRAVDASVYDGVFRVQEGVDQMRDEALVRDRKHVDRLIKYAPLIADYENKRQGRTDITAQDTIDGVEYEYGEFTKSVDGQANKIIEHLDAINYGIGWTEGPRHQFEPAVTAIGAAGLGIAAGAAAF